MINWNTDEKAFKKNSPKEYALWRLTQLINYGLGREKLNAEKVRKYINKLNIDKDKKRYIKFLLTKRG